MWTGGENQRRQLHSWNGHRATAISRAIAVVEDYKTRNCGEYVDPARLDPAYKPSGWRHHYGNAICEVDLYNYHGPVTKTMFGRKTLVQLHASAKQRARTDGARPPRQASSGGQQSG